MDEVRKTFCQSGLDSATKACSEVKGETEHHLFGIQRTESLNQNNINALWKLELISRFSITQTLPIALRSFFPQL